MALKHTKQTTPKKLMLRSLRDAQARCFLEHGNTCDICCQSQDNADGLFEVMDIELNLPETDEHGGACCGRKGKNFTYSLDGEYMYASRFKEDKELYYLSTTTLPEPTEDYNQIVCRSSSDACKDVGYTVSKNGVWVKP